MRVRPRYKLNITVSYTSSDEHVGGRDVQTCTGCFDAFLQSLLSLRFRPNHAKERSTTQLRGKKTKPFAPLGRRMISSAGAASLINAVSNFSPA